jgi:tetratricopeptide (TPR) repeat protein
VRRGWRIAAVAAIATATLTVGALTPVLRGGSEPEPLPSASSATAALARAGGDALDRSIEQLRLRVTSVPHDAGAWARLGLAYVRRAAIAGDPGDYTRAETAIDRSLAAEPGNPDGVLGSAVLAAARHDFASALRLGARARADAPFDPAVAGIVGDALLERGRYGDAFATFQRMVDLRPDTASLSRVSYARELTGDLAGAIRAMRAARRFAATPADAAWTQVQLGNLYLNAARPRRAAELFRGAARLDPRSTAALAGSAICAAARGELDRARRLADQVLARNPSPEHAILAGDLATIAGDRAAARRAYDLASVGFGLLQANGVRVDLELALFEADHGAPRRALAAARAAWRARPTVHAADALAWALHVNGRDAAASRFARRARSLGTDEGLFAFHAGMIELARGRSAAGRTLLREALAIDPWFSILVRSTAIRVLARGSAS